MNGSQIVYLGSPYSAPSTVAEDDRYKEACKAVAILSASRVVVYSPIVHFHNVARGFGMPTDANYWRTCNHAMLRVSRVLAVLCLSGWEVSKGLQDEISFARGNDMPIQYMDPVQLTRGQYSDRLLELTSLNPRG